jgi:hypothetical protein
VAALPLATLVVRDTRLGAPPGVLCDGARRGANAMHFSTPRSAGQIRALLRALPLLLAVGGCALFYQDRTTVLVREPGHYFYSPPVPVESAAREYWEYATIAGLAYPQDQLDKTACATSNIFVPDLEAKERDVAGLSGPEVASLAEKRFSAIYTALVDLGWRSWQDFPDPTLFERMQQLDLYVDVWERQTPEGTIVVVAFKGTNFWAWQDWNANLRWVLGFIPGHFDQYDEVVQKFGPAFLKAFKAHIPPDEQKRTVVYAAGHSLGGGLAQQFSYALPLDDPPDPPGLALPRISKVYAFDPSPVTGYYSVPAAIRDVNEKGVKGEDGGLAIGRILEKGEILSYLRYIVTLVYFPSSEDPAIEGVRFNLFPSLSPLTSHSIDELACKLFEAATSTGAAPKHYDPETKRRAAAAESDAN